MAKEDGERGGGFDNFLIYEGLGKKEGGLVYNQSVQELWVRGTSSNSSVVC